MAAVAAVPASPSPPSSPVVSKEVVDRFYALWDKVPGKEVAESDGAAVEYLPNAAVVSVLSRSSLPRDWLKEIYSNSRAGATGRIPGLNKDQFALSCVLTAVCKQHAGQAEFPWSAVTEAMVAFSQLRGLNILGVSSADFSTVSFPDLSSPIPPLPARDGEQDALKSGQNSPPMALAAPPEPPAPIFATPAREPPPPPLVAPPPPPPVIQNPVPASPPATPTREPPPPPSVPSPSQTPPVPGPRADPRPETIPGTFPQDDPPPYDWNDIPRNDVAATQPSGTQPPHRPVPPPPLPSRDQAAEASETQAAGNPFGQSAAANQAAEQMLSDEEMARRLQAEEEEELARALQASRLAAEAETANARAAQQLIEDDRRRAMEAEDEEFARRLQAEEEALSRPPSGALQGPPAFQPPPMMRPSPLVMGPPLPRPVSALPMPPVSAPPAFSFDPAMLQQPGSPSGGLAFPFFPAADLLLPAAYGRSAYGVKRMEHLSGNAASEDIYMQYGPRDRDARAGHPLLWIHFFFNDADTARRCRGSWPRKSEVVAGVGLSVNGFRLPAAGLECSSKGFDSMQGGIKRHQHVFVLKKAGQQLSPNMLIKLNQLVTQILRDPFSPVSIPEGGALSRQGSLTVTTAPRTASREPVPPPVARSASTPASYPVPRPAPAPASRPPSATAPRPSSAVAPSPAASASSSFSMPRPTSIDASSNDDADSTGDTCIVCWDAARTHSLFPCGHRSYCAACATAIMSSGDKKCSVCRQTVLGAARVYV